ncbi:hypothetical protein ACS0TY_029487 [Phlomoides rotata]
MENYRAGVVEELPSSLTNIKVHGGMCSELAKLVVRVSEIIPEIEAARPRGSGIETLSLLVEGISEAKSRLQRWSQFSTLYLALTGNEMLSKCNKTRNLLEKCLDQIQHMVPRSLATEICGIIVGVRRAEFGFDPREEKAGKALQEMLQKYCCKRQDSAVSCIQAVCCWLHISSPKALVSERRSIKMQLSKVGGGSKSKILRLFLSLLNKLQSHEYDDGVGDQHHQSNATGQTSISN